MAYWLKNVGQFLEKLDDQAGKAVEDQKLSGAQPLQLLSAVATRGRRGEVDEEEHDDEAETAENLNLESVLAARGLQKNDTMEYEGGEQDEIEEEKDFNLEKQAEAKDYGNDQHAKDAVDQTTDSELPSDSCQGTQEDVSQKEAAPSSARSESDAESTVEQESALRSTIPVVGTEQEPVTAQASNESSERYVPATDEDLEEITGSAKNEDHEEDSRAKVVKAFVLPRPPTALTKSDTELTVDTTLANAAPAKIVPDQIMTKSVVSATKATMTPSATPHASTGGTPINADAMAAIKVKLRESQKESRTLRRHILALNDQLEKAEAEMNAQRRELEQAAVQMEKERALRKQERETERQKQADEIKKLKLQHESASTLMKQQLKEMEQQRMREGGDLHKELTEAVQREREALEKCAAQEDEKQTLLSQISTLQSQQEALGNRLESLTMTMDNAMQREREAELRLDEALSAHARQISQRQARESELERTIAELGAALVAARSNEGKSATATGISSSENHNVLGNEGSESMASSSSSASRELFRQEIETLTAQLVHEQQRNAALHAELREMTKERTEEAALAQTRQIHHDRQVAELSVTITRLKAEAQEMRRNSTALDSFHGKSSLGGEDEDAKQIKSLSEEVLRLRERATSFNSEVAALKNRLKVANDRAERVEAALEEALLNNGGNTDGNSDIEGGVDGGRIKHRGMFPKRRAKRDAPSFRSAFRLEGLQGEKSERVGKTLDALDTFLIQSGKFLRFNPVARFLFLIYFLLLHLWTFALILFHAHGYETLHGDFGAGGSFPHGPGALMQQAISLPKPEIAVGGK